MKFIRILPLTVRQHPVPVLQLHPEHRVRAAARPPCPRPRSRLPWPCARALRPPWAAPPVVLVSTSGPVLRDGDRVLEVGGQAPVLRSPPSSRPPASRTSQLPIVTIGSIASTMPGLSCGPAPGSPKFGTCGSSWSCPPDAVADEGAHDREAVALDVRLDGVGDVAEPVAGAGTARWPCRGSRG